MKSKVYMASGFGDGLKGLEHDLLIISIDEFVAHHMSEPEIKLYDEYVDAWNKIGVDIFPKYKDNVFLIYNERLNRTRDILQVWKENKFDMSAIEEAYSKFWFVANITGDRKE